MPAPGDLDQADAAGGAPPERGDAAADAARLWHGCFHGVLSTRSQVEPDWPFGSVVPYCCDPTGAPLLLLSPLAQHWRNLDADPRCSLTVHDGADGEDIQQSRRLTCLAVCAAEPDPASLARYCRHFPQGRDYAAQLGFRLYRLSPRRFHYNGGFATARWLGAERIPGAAPLPPDMELALLADVARDHRDWLAAQCPADATGPVEPIAADPWGMTLNCGTRLLRRELTAAAGGAEALAAALADNRLKPPPGRR